jgi:hypothetical protein
MKKTMSGYDTPKIIVHQAYISPESKIYLIMRYMRSLGVLLNLIIVPVL